MPTTPLRLDMFDDDSRPRDWNPKRTACKGPFRIARLCIFGMFLPAMLVTGPVYLRYRVYADQLYPLAASDQRLIDGKVSTTWCQRQVVRANATFNAYLMNGEPEMKNEPTPVSMTRHLVLEDDMKEYWGFYLLRGSSVTVSTCVRWPGASLTIIRGHKHLQECAFIGDDSSEELEELLEVADEQGLLNGTGIQKNLDNKSPINAPDKMKRARQDVEFHHKANAPHPNGTLPKSPTNHLSYTSHELDAAAMRDILTKLFVKTLDMKNKQKGNSDRKHYQPEGVFREESNIVKPPIVRPDEFLWSPEMTTEKSRWEGISSTTMSSTLENPITEITDDKMKSKVNLLTADTSKANIDASKTETFKNLNETTRDHKSDAPPTLSEVFDDVLKKISGLGVREKKILQKLIDETDEQDGPKNITKAIENAIANSSKSDNMRKSKVRRQVALAPPELRSSLSGDNDDDDEDAAIEEEDLHPDGIAEDRGTVNETTSNDRSNSEFWSSFSSSEERLLECKGLILNLPLTPHHYCSKEFEKDHVAASIANTVTYRVPTDGYYFFVFSSENEIQANYVRIQFDLIKTTYNTSNPVHSCKNSTEECSLPFNFFSWERTILELPVTGNDSQWNEEYIVLSRCEPRTSIYLICIITVPILILLFAFH